jgi:RNA polymerase-binding transcription factor DksA
MALPRIARMAGPPAKERRERLAQAAEPLERHSLNMADTATDEFDHDMALSEVSTEQDALLEIEEAINRILNGTYGLCEETGQPIPPERLKAVPWTRFAREAEARLEREGVLHRTHFGTLGSVGDLAETRKPITRPL